MKTKKYLGDFVPDLIPVLNGLAAEIHDLKIQEQAMRDHLADVYEDLRHTTEDSSDYYDLCDESDALDAQRDLLKESIEGLEYYYGELFDQCKTWGGKPEWRLER